MTVLGDIATEIASAAAAETAAVLAAVETFGEPPPVPAFDPADLSTLPPLDFTPDTDPSLLGEELRYVIERWILAHPRSQQVELGPSDIGTDCDRRLTYGLSAHPRATPELPGWRPTVGTAVHTWLADTFGKENASMYAVHGTYRWLIEQRVRMGTVNSYGDIDGNGDLYDRQTGTVIDWKIVGTSSLKKYRRAMRSEYRVQTHGYGRGWSLLGLPVTRVMVVCLPAAGELADMVVWSEPYDEQVAVKALQRADRLHSLVSAVGLATALTLTNGALRAAGLHSAANPRGLNDEPAIPAIDAGCRFCPWLLSGSTDLTKGCPGAPDMATTWRPGANGGDRLADAAL